MRSGRWWPITIDSSTSQNLRVAPAPDCKRHMKEEFRRKLGHELREFLAVFLFLALFFSAFTTYRMLLVNEFHLKYFSYGSALVSALVLSKIILLGEYAHLGRRFEGTALIVSTLYKSLAFGLLTAAFHVLEEGIKELVLRKTPFHPGESRNLNELLARTLVMFCAFIPFFAFRETARVLGEGKLYQLFFRGRGVAEFWVFTRPVAETGEPKRKQPTPQMR
jgi:hypothetical protein